MQKLAIPKTVPPRPKKRIIPRQVRAFHRTFFVVKKDRGRRSEQDVLVHFGSEVHCHVIKLSTHGYPKVDANGTPITWISNFGVVDWKGRYVDGLKYTLVLPALPEGHCYVNYDKGQVIDLVPIQTVQPTQVVLVELTSGDPPIGIKPK